MANPLESRANFLKLMKAGGASVALLLLGGDKLILSLEETRLDTQTQKAIFNHLGLTPDQLELHWAIRSHNLDDRFIDLYIDGKPKPIIIGELKPNTLDDKLMSWSEDIQELTGIERLLYPGEGSSNERNRREMELVKDLVQEDYTFVATDSSVAQLYQDGARHPDFFNRRIIEGGLGILQLGVANALLMKLLQEAKKTSPDQAAEKIMESPHVKILISLVALSTGLLAWPKFENLTSHLKGNEDGENSNFGQHTSEIEMMLEKILTEESPFVRYAEGLIKLRNLVMALNTWHTLARTAVSPDQKTEFVFFAGNGHSGVDDDFLKGPEILADEAREYATRLTHHTLDILESAVKEGVMTREEGALALAGYCQMFSQPQKIGDGPVLDPLANHDKEIPSAALILWQALEERSNALRASNQVSDKVQYQILREAQLTFITVIATEMKSLWLGELETRGNTTTNLPEDSQGPLPNHTSWFTKKDRLNISATALWYSYDTFVVAATPLGGGIYPVLRNYWSAGPDANVYAMDYIALPRGQQYFSTIYTYVPLPPGIQNGPDTRPLDFGLEFGARADTSVLAAGRFTQKMHETNRESSIISYLGPDPADDPVGIQFITLQFH